MSILLELTGVSQHFGGVKALTDVSLHVREGEVLGLLGPNGAGKTTLFNIIAGLFPPSSGDIIFDRRNISKVSADRRCVMGIARTFQLIHPFSSLTVLENIMVGSLVRERRIGRALATARDVARQVDLTALEGRLPSTLSVIEAKRLEMARALATKPRLLLLDEISNGLRSDELASLFETVDSLRETGTTLIVIEHNMAALRYMCERVVAIDSGRVLMEGTPEDVLRDQRIIETYLGDAGNA